VKDVEGVAVAAGRAFCGAGSYVVGGEGGVAGIAICVAAGVEIGEGVCVAGRCRGVVCCS